MKLARRALLGGGGRGGLGRFVTSFWDVFD